MGDMWLDAEQDPATHSASAATSEGTQEDEDRIAAPVSQRLQHNAARGHLTISGLKISMNYALLLVWRGAKGR